jgi:hypothetical protein
MDVENEIQQFVLLSKHVFQLYKNEEKKHKKKQLNPDFIEAVQRFHSYVKPFLPVPISAKGTVLLPNKQPPSLQPTVLPLREKTLPPPIPSGYDSSSVGTLAKHRVSKASSSQAAAAAIVIHDSCTTWGFRPPVVETSRSIHSTHTGGGGGSAAVALSSSSSSSATTDKGTKKRDQVMFQHAAHPSKYLIHESCGVLGFQPPLTTGIFAQQQLQQHSLGRDEGELSPDPETYFGIKKQKRIKPSQDFIVYKESVTISGRQRRAVLQFINRILQNKNKGKKFRESHDTTVFSEALVVHQQPMNHKNDTTPYCIICQRKLARGEERCKLSVIHEHREKPVDFCEKDRVDKCETHSYCLVCFVIFMATVRPGREVVCFGTCLTKRGGCRHAKEEGMREERESCSYVPEEEEEEEDEYEEDEEERSEIVHMRKQFESLQQEEEEEDNDDDHSMIYNYTDDESVTTDGSHVTSRSAEE